MSKLDYRNMVWGTIRDYSKNPAPAAFQVCIYGVTMKDIAVVGENTIGARPFHKAIDRMGMGIDSCAWPRNMNRESPHYMATLWELNEECRIKKRT